MKSNSSSFWLVTLQYTFMLRISLLLFNMGSFMFIVRAYSKSDFAIWALYLTICMSVEGIKQGLLRNATLKQLARADDRGWHSMVQASSLYLSFGISLIAGLLFTTGSEWIAGFLQIPGLAPLLPWSIVYLLLLVPFNHAEIILQAQFRFKRILAAYAVRQGLFFILIAATFIFQSHFISLQTLILLHIASLAIATILLLILSWPYLKPLGKLPIRSTKQIFQFGRFSFGSNLLQNINRNLDQYLTAHVLPDLNSRAHFVSYYNTVSRINTAVDTPSLAVADVLYPKNVQVMESEGVLQVKYYLERMLAGVLCLMVPASLILFVLADFIVQLLAGDGFEQAALILRYTILLGLARPIDYQFSATLDSIGKPKLNFRIHLLFFIINLLLMYSLLRLKGGMGAAYASMLFYAFSLLIMLLILQKQVQLEWKPILRYMREYYTLLFNRLLAFFPGTHK